ncbi:hypothetical protein [Nocardia pneumoniae]|uniref:hypothetical protein n=1 Tax=Nocardia pneumoniae TaxID=228601 RepID=UPI000304213D|nr:hypothetical protein [Nocardia pneumoniae]
MNPLLLIGAAILVTGLLVLVATMLLRPTSSRTHLSVAELQARLAKEQEDASPAPESSENAETVSGEDTRSEGTTRLTMPPVRRQLPYPIADADGATREPASVTNDDGTTSEPASTVTDDGATSEPAPMRAADDVDPVQAQRRAAAAEMLRRIASA